MWGTAGRGTHSGFVAGGGGVFSGAWLVCAAGCGDGLSEPAEAVELQGVVIV